MTSELPVGVTAKRSVKILPRGFLVASGALLGGLLLLAFAYGLDVFSFPALWWRDQPFDYGNILHTVKTLSLGSRLWAYDPLHLFGWIPNAFYNPLATLIAAPFGQGEGAYRVWLLVVLWVSSLACLPLLPRKTSTIGWVAGGLLAALLSLLVYPGDVGLLDANPVQALYTGQWAQRLGVFLGILSIERFVRALEAWSEPILCVRRSLVAAMLLGATLFSHFMSGYATAVVMAIVLLMHLLARRLIDGRFRLATLLVLPAVLVACLLLFADFFYVLLALNPTYHSLPLLGWQVPLGALATVREVLLPALPIVLIPAARTLLMGDFKRVGISRLTFPLLVYLIVSLTSIGNALVLSALVFAAALLSSRIDREFRARHWLPVAACFLLVLSCGPGSLHVLGLDLSVFVPFHDSVGWAKLAAMSRMLLIVWFGVLAAEGLDPAEGKQRLARGIVIPALVLLGLALPLLLSLDAPGHSGAQTFFEEMNATDRDATERLTERMRDAARQTPPDGYLLLEDTLHHPPGSTLEATRVPNGHLPYLTGNESGRPVLGGCVTTRMLTHPYAQTSRGRLLCTSLDAAGKKIFHALDRLRDLGVANILAHSKQLVSALETYPAAHFLNREAGLALFALEQYRPLLTDIDGSFLPGARLFFAPGETKIDLPAGESALRLRQVYYPFLRCEASGPSGPRDCHVSSWSDGKETFRGCLVDDPRKITVDVPWIQVNLEPDPCGAELIKLTCRPPLMPFIVMLLAWLAALAWLLVRRRLRRYS